MSKVYQCDKCGRIFEPRVLQNGEPYITSKGRGDLDLCPECYDSLMAWLKHDDDECKCDTCKNLSLDKNVCKECSRYWNDEYEEAENDDS